MYNERRSERIPGQEAFEAVSNAFHRHTLETWGSTDNYYRHKFNEAEKPKPEPMGTIYFVSYHDGGPIKIGYTTNLNERMRHLQTASPYDMKLLAKVSGDTLVERWFHAEFAEHNLRGEWFEPAQPILDEIERLSACPSVTPW